MPDSPLLNDAAVETLADDLAALDGHPAVRPWHTAEARRKLRAFLAAQDREALIRQIVRADYERYVRRYGVHPGIDETLDAVDVRAVLDLLLPVDDPPEGG